MVDESFLLNVVTKTVEIKGTNKREIHQTFGDNNTMTETETRGNYTARYTTGIAQLLEPKQSGYGELTFTAPNDAEAIRLVGTAMRELDLKLRTHYVMAEEIRLADGWHELSHGEINSEACAQPTLAAQACDTHWHFGLEDLVRRN